MAMLELPSLRQTDEADERGPGHIADIENIRLATGRELAAAKRSFEPGSSLPRALEKLRQRGLQIVSSADPELASLLIDRRLAINNAINPLDLHLEQELAKPDGFNLRLASRKVELVASGDSALGFVLDDAESAIMETESRDKIFLLGELLDRGGFVNIDSLRARYFLGAPKQPDQVRKLKVLAYSLNRTPLGEAGAKIFVRNDYFVLGNHDGSIFLEDPRLLPPIDQNAVPEIREFPSLSEGVFTTREHLMGALNPVLLDIIHGEKVHKNNLISLRDSLRKATTGSSIASRVRDYIGIIERLIRNADLKGFVESKNARQLTRGLS